MEGISIDTKTDRLEAELHEDGVHIHLSEPMGNMHTELGMGAVITHDGIKQLWDMWAEQNNHPTSQGVDIVDDNMVLWDIPLKINGIERSRLVLTFSTDLEGWPSVVARLDHKAQGSE